MLALLRREVGIPEQIGHADDGVHGGADFMAHVGQEITLGCVGHIRFNGGLLEQTIGFL